MPSQIVRLAWAAVLAIAAGLAGAEAFLAANVVQSTSQKRSAPNPETVEPPLARRTRSPQPVNSPPPAPITRPGLPENSLRLDPLSLTFNPGAPAPEAAPQPHAPTPAFGDAPVTLTNRA